MTIQDVKQIKLADYLQSLGYTPVKQQGRNLWYKSPLREETDASFKVNTELERWYDFGIGKGGNILALAAELYRSEDVAYLLRRIEERTAYIRPASFSFGRQHSDNRTYQGLKVGELSSPALIAYLQERGINIGLAKRECRELRFMNADKPYLPSAFRTWQEDMKCATDTSRDVSPRKTSPISDSRADNDVCVTCSRGSWITFHSLPSE